MSQGNYAPPPKSGGMSTMTIVLIIFGVLGLICVGACGVCGYTAMTAGKTFLATAVATATMADIQQHPEVKAELGEPLEVQNAKWEQTADTVTVSFDVKGSKNTGKAKVEIKGADPNNAANSKPSSVIVTLPSGKTIDASKPPMNIPEMPEGTDGTDMPDLSTPPDGTTPPDSTDPPEEPNN